MIKQPPSFWKTVLRLSRPLFWVYLAGPYLIGYSAFANSRGDFFRLDFWYSLFFFLIPANIIIYGVNDLYDQDTDRYNSKKEHHETKVTDSNKSIYTNAIMISFVASLPLFLYLPLFAKILLIVFLFLGIGYSTPPIRFKAKPFVDSLSNILYAFPAFIATYQLTSDGLSIPIFIAVACWTAAMHLFSAIPDIRADSEAKLRTTAVVLGRRTSLLVCLGLWSVTALLAFIYSPWLIIFLVYPFIPYLVLTNPRATLETVYWAFPKVNLLVGFLLFLVIVLT